MPGLSPGTTKVEIPAAPGPPGIVGSSGFDFHDADDGGALEDVRILSPLSNEPQILEPALRLRQHVEVQFELLHPSPLDFQRLAKAPGGNVQRRAGVSHLGQGVRGPVRRVGRQSGEADRDPRRVV